MSAGEKVEHETDANRFVLRRGADEAELTYRIAGSTGNIMVVDHTGVPAAMQHEGIANRLAEAALAFARERQMRVDPQCRFMAVYLRRHPEHAALLAAR